VSGSAIVSVHERLDQPGYIVKVVAGGRAIRFPVDDREEAALLAESIRDGVNAGIPLEALMADATEDEP